MKFHKNKHMERDIIIAPQNKCCGCDDLEEKHELETTSALNEIIVEPEAEEKDHPHVNYLHVEIF